MTKGCLVVLPIPSAHANDSIMSSYITRSSAIWRRKVEALSREVPLIADTSAQLSVLKLGQKLKRLRRYDRSKFFTKNPLMHHALLRRRVAPNICCNLLELSYSYFQVTFKRDVEPNGLPFCSVEFKTFIYLAKLVKLCSHLDLDLSYKKIFLFTDYFSTTRFHLFRTTFFSTEKRANHWVLKPYFQ